MVTHFDMQRTRFHRRKFRRTAWTCLFITVVGACVVPLGFLGPAGCSRWLGKAHLPLPPVVIRIDWGGVGAGGNEVPKTSISGRLMQWSSDAPHNSSLHMISGTVEGHPATGDSVWLETDSGQETKEVYHILVAVVMEEGHPVLVIEGTSEVVWWLEAAKGGDKIIVARQGEKESALPLDLQPGPFHIRIEARDQKKTK